MLQLAQPYLQNDGFINIFSLTGPNYYPAQRPYRSAYPISSPQRTTVFHGYYARPSYNADNAERAMSAFAAGESVQTGSANFEPKQYGLECINCGENIADPNQYERNNRQNVEAEQSGPEIQENTPQFIESNPEARPIAESTTTLPDVTTQRPKKSSPRNRNPVVIEDEDDEENEEPAYNPLNGARGRYPVYNSFFPMVFGGSEDFNGRFAGSSKKGSQSQSDGQSRRMVPGVTAIANSFSTGKGGVATSHATAYGSSPQ